MAKQIVLSFRRELSEKNGNAQYHTQFSFNRIDVRSSDKQVGIFHKLYNFKENNIIGDVPSLQKSINSYTPNSFGGKAVKATAKVAYGTVETAANAAIKTGMIFESAEQAISSAAANKVVQKFRQKTRENAVDDTSRAMLAGSVLLKDMYKGIKAHNENVKFYKREKSNYLQQKKENKNLISKNNKNLQKRKRQIHQAKQKYSLTKKKFKHQTDKSNVSKLLFKKRKQLYKQYKKDYISFFDRTIKENKKINKLNKVKKKVLSKNKPVDLFSAGLTYSVMNGAGAMKRKVIYADSSNDFLRAAQMVERVQALGSKKKSKPTKIEKKKNKLESKVYQNQLNLETHNKLLDEENKLKRAKNKKRKKNNTWKSQSHTALINKIKQKARKKKKIKKSLSEIGTKEFITKSVIGSAVAIPTILILFAIIFLLLIFSMFGSDGYVPFMIGTYTTDDEILSEASVYYTLLYYKFNEKVLKISNTEQWKIIFLNLGIDYSEIKNDTEPPEFQFGYSTFLPYSPTFNYDPYKLYSFLCAVNYQKNEDIENSNTTTNGHDVNRFWKFNSTCKKACDEIFNKQYSIQTHFDLIRTQSENSDNSENSQQEEKTHHKIYYNVYERNFDSCAMEYLGEMEDGEARQKYYMYLVGLQADKNGIPSYQQSNVTSLYGNHQALPSPIDMNFSDILKNNLILHKFGYVITGWNEENPQWEHYQGNDLLNHHINIYHKGIDIKCSEGTNVYAMITGRVTALTNNSITIESEESAYDNESFFSDWMGNKQAARITYENVNTNGIKVDDIVNKNQIIGTTNSNRKCPEMINDDYAYNGDSFLHLNIQLSNNIITTSRDYKDIDPMLLINLKTNRNNGGN